MRLAEQKQSLEAMVNSRQQEVKSLLSEKAKYGNKSNLNFDRIDSAINKREIEVESLEKQIAEIARILELPPSMVSREVKVIRAEWKQSALRDFDEFKG